MPPSSRKQQIAAAHKKGQSILAEKRATLTSETALDDLWESLQAANLRIEELEQQLAQKDTELSRLRCELEKSGQKLQKNQNDSALWKEKHGKMYYELRMQRLEILMTAEKAASKQFLRGSHESYQAIISLEWENETLHS